MTTDAEKPEGNEEQEKPKRPATRRQPGAASARPASGRATRTRAQAKPAEVKAPAADTAGESAVTGAAAPKKAPAKRQKTKVETKPLPRLMARYREEILPQLVQDFEYSSSMQAPKVSKVVINVGLGEALTNSRALEIVPEHVATISGQKPMVTKARKSIAGFKLREGQAIGVTVTLRGRRMYEFLDRLISTALPRIRDFRGISRTAFDGKGNYALGLRDQLMFPEIDYGSIDRARGLQITITTTAQNDPEGMRLLELLGMPFAREATAA